METTETSIHIYFASLEDPRVVGRCDHELLDILTVALLAMVAGADDFSMIEDFGNSRLDWLKTFLSLKNGIPSDDTFRRVFSALEPTQFERCFQQWANSLLDSTEGKLIAIDGKTLRRSYTKRNGPIHLVHAWAQEHRLLLGQVATSEKSNEITAIPELLRLLDIKGATITIDAMGCQKEIASQIVTAKADYILSLKDNHPTFCSEVKTYFEDMKASEEMSHHETTDGGHGRIEIRKIYVTQEVDWYAECLQWKGLKSLIMIESERQEGEKTSREKRYYISSLKESAASLLGKIRGHWSVENELHWGLDVSFGEDGSRMREGYGAENLSLLRKMALMMLKRESSSKRGVAAKRKRAGWDPSYLAKVLADHLILF
jgi:predicted transposase YbfD/YdcC